MERVKKEQQKDNEQFVAMLDQTHQKKETKLLTSLLEMVKIHFEYHDVIPSLPFFLPQFLLFSFHRAFSSSSLALVHLCFEPLEFRRLCSMLRILPQ